MRICFYRWTTARSRPPLAAYRAHTCAGTRTSPTTKYSLLDPSVWLALASHLLLRRTLHPAFSVSSQVKYLYVLLFQLNRQVPSTAVPARVFSGDANRVQPAGSRRADGPGGARDQCGIDGAAVERSALVWSCGCCSSGSARRRLATSCSSHRHRRALLRTRALGLPLRAQSEQTAAKGVEARSPRGRQRASRGRHARMLR